jgi:hypothetical protein
MYGYRIHPLLVLIIAFSFLSSFSVNPACSEEQPIRWDLGLGAGLNLDGADSGHLLVAAGFSDEIQGWKYLRYRIEGDLEFIERKREITVVAGVAPFIRLIGPSGDIKPYFEIGGGPNLISRTHIGPRRLGGGFIFSLMAGVGVELNSPLPSNLSLRFRHLSNGGIFRFNHSINSLFIVVSSRFQ